MSFTVNSGTAGVGIKGVGVGMEGGVGVGLEAGLEEGITGGGVGVVLCADA